MVRDVTFYPSNCSTVSQISSPQSFTHQPVLENEVLGYLQPKNSDWIVDCTLGLGGHSQSIIEMIGEDGHLIGIDLSKENLAQAKDRLKNYPNISFFHDNFKNLAEIVKKAGGQGKIQGILFDLGLSSAHLEDHKRGFSFQNEGPLDMRFDLNQNLTAGDIINTYAEPQLIHIFSTYGQEPYTRRIAATIVQHRKQSKIRTTTELAEIIKRATPFRHYHRIHPATRVFQALRIAVNRELEVLESALGKAIEIVNPEGRIVIISFHSLEDGVVKHLFRRESKKEPPTIKILTKKPVTPNEEEITENPRSRSAKLRACEKI